MTMRTVPAIGVDIHFGPDNIRHKYHPGDDKCHAYGVIKIDNGGATYATLYFDADPAHIDKMIAELVALKQEMAPPVPGCDCMADAEPAQADPERPFPCCAHCVPGCDAKLGGHRIACTTPGCTSAAPAQEHGYVTPAMAERRDKAAAEYADRRADGGVLIGPMTGTEIYDITGRTA